MFSSGMWSVNDIYGNSIACGLGIANRFHRLQQYPVVGGEIAQINGYQHDRFDTARIDNGPVCF
jgi:hypothetical protein